MAVKIEKTGVVEVSGDNVTNVLENIDGYIESGQQAQIYEGHIVACEFMEL